jgi:mannose-6-phosphate isomerase-like protein (cupin superfamily)
MKFFVGFYLCIISYTGQSQTHSSLSEIVPPAEYQNIHVEKIAEDSLQSSFIIWIKDNVNGHFHQEHTENIVVLEGKADMLFNGKKIIVKKGDYLNIPKGTTHSVEKVLSKKPLKVLSIQSPHFDGKDRIFTTTSL